MTLPQYSFNGQSQRKLFNKSKTNIKDRVAIQHFSRALPMTIITHKGLRMQNLLTI